MFLINTDSELLMQKEEEVKTIKAIIFDDTSLEKIGKHIEGIGYVHDHVKNAHILGFKLLLCGYYDGKSFIPLDFYVLNENRKDKLKDSLNNKQSKLKLKITEIKELRAKIKINKREVFKANQVFKSKSNKTNEKKLNTKKCIKEKFVKKLIKIQVEKNTLLAKVSELSQEYSELKTLHCGMKKKSI
ncbi:MAG: hypothetical protein U9Q83_04445 [Bacteroidota bacterium]|nr:hypothetical protein [Bacteroidota bacterium]